MDQEKQPAAAFMVDVVAALHAVWAQVQAKKPNLSQAIIIVASGSEEVRTPKRGHFGADRWEVDSKPYAEVLIAGEILGEGPESVLSTLLHEGAHCLAKDRKKTDTNKGGKYHNKIFKALAEELGLIVEKSNRGWNVTCLAPGTAGKYDLKPLEAALKGYRNNMKTGSVIKKPCRLVKWVCECGRIIRGASETMLKGRIMCGICETEFKADPGEGEGSGADDND